MQIVRYPGEDPAWAVVDDRGILRHIAGSLAAWAPRIAGGEGVSALPRTGRCMVADRAELSDLRPLLRRRFTLPSESGGAPSRLVAIVAASLAGRSNPFRSFLGYGLLDAIGDCRVLLTRDEFGDAPPQLACQACHGRLEEQVRALDAEVSLATGDAIVLGAPVLASRLADRLAGANLDRSMQALRRAGCVLTDGAALPGTAARL